MTCLSSLPSTSKSFTGADGDDGTQALSDFDALSGYNIEIDFGVLNGAERAVFSAIGFEAHDDPF